MLKNVKSPIAAIMLSVISLAAFAQSAGSENFQQHQAMEVQHIEAHIAQAQAHLACVRSATSHETLHACNQQAQEQMHRDGPPPRH